MTEQRGFARFRQLHGLARLVAFQELVGQGQNVGTTLTQWCQVQREDIEPVEEVFTKTTGGHFFLEIAVGGGNDAHIQRHGLAAAQAFHFFFLEHTQQFRLQANIDLGDFIQQQGATIGLFEFTGPGGVGTGECAFLIAKQHGFQHGLGNGRTIDGYKRLVAAARIFMNEAGIDFFAAAGITTDHDGNIGGSDTTSQFRQFTAAWVFHNHGAGIDSAQAKTLNHFHQNFCLEGLHHIVGGAGLHRFDRLVDSAVGGNQHERNFRILTLDRFQQFIAIESGHLHVADNQVNFLARKQAQCGFGCFGL